jgi:hypothetical protein
MADLDVPNERIVLNARNVSTVPKGAHHDDLVRGLILLVRPSARREFRRSWVCASPSAASASASALFPSLALPRPARRPVRPFALSTRAKTLPAPARPVSGPPTKPGR